MAEEHRYQAPEGHRLCANNCGFFGIPTMMNLCSKCYRDYCLKEQQKASVKASLSSSSLSPLSLVLDSQPHPVRTLPEAQSPATPESAAVEQPQPNRCFSCKKRVGLTGFKCRCGITFCGTHRYPEKHNCSFDFKKIGKEEIKRANPLVIAEKLNKI